MKFYFDMDNTITDFDARFPNSAELNHPSESLDETARALKKQFWRNVEQTDNFWRYMPMIKNADYMLSVANEYGEIFILSKTPGAKHFQNGEKYVKFVANEKREWVLKHFQHLFNEQHIIICDCKKGALIHPTQNDILIDDRPENIEEWIENGGRGILFRTVADTVQRIKANNFTSNIKQG